MGENLTEKEKPDVQSVSGGGDGSGNRKKGDTRVGLSLRILVSVYLLYLAYGLIQGFGDAAGNDRIFFAIAIVVFLAAGGAILVLSAKKLIKKEYADAEEQAEENEEQ